RHAMRAGRGAMFPLARGRRSAGRDATRDTDVNPSGESAVIVGGCLCNGVRYEYDGRIEEISMCHCSMCRKAQGSAYVAISPIDASKFRIVRGRRLLKEFR